MATTTDDRRPVASGTIPATCMDCGRPAPASLVCCACWAACCDLAASAGDAWATLQADAQRAYPHANLTGDQAHKATKKNPVPDAF